MKKLAIAATLALVVGVLGLPASSAAADSIICSGTLTGPVIGLPFEVCVNEPGQGPIISVPPITATPPAAPPTTGGGSGGSTGGDTGGSSGGSTSGDTTGGGSGSTDTGGSAPAPQQPVQPAPTPAPSVSTPTPSATPTPSDQAQNDFLEHLAPFGVFLAALVTIFLGYELYSSIRKWREKKKLAKISKG